MNKKLLPWADQRNCKYDQKRGRAVRHVMFACLLVLCMSYTLILSAAAREQQTFCQQEAHVHTYDCFVQRGITERPVFFCSNEVFHVHDPSCYDEQGRLLCGQADYVIHEHEAVCFDAEGTLLCPLPQVCQHIHTEHCYDLENRHVHENGCYTMELGQLLCELPEETGHVHEAACFGPGEAILCAIEEGHIHAEGCFAEEVLICQIPEGHFHEDVCYERILQCLLPETEGHLHGEGCYEQTPILTCQLAEYAGDPVLVCTEPEAMVHVHTRDCCKMEPVKQPLTCKLPEDEQHMHFRFCYGQWDQICAKEEHIHTAACYTDRAADCETEEIWESTFAHVELTGNWDKDVLLIAQTQLGYRESDRNIIVLEDGVSIHGYTRYGEWYGDHYGDWCAMFVSFCLHYAGVDAMPLEAYCPTWVELLSDSELDLFRPVGTYTPQPGDLIFFDYERDGISDHVGFVVEQLEATEETPAQYRTLEGNSADQVRYAAYDLDDVRIQGFGILPENPHVAKPGAHVHYVSCYDTAGHLICQPEADAESHIQSEIPCEEAGLQTLEAFAPYSSVFPQVQALGRRVEHGEVTVVNRNGADSAQPEPPRLAPALTAVVLLLLSTSVLLLKLHTVCLSSDEHQTAQKRILGKQPD